MGGTGARREPWLVWWYKNAFEPFVIPTRAARLILLAAKIGAVATGLWVASPSISPAPVHVLQALAGASGGFLYFYILTHTLWRGSQTIRMRPWGALGEGAKDMSWASPAVALTFLAYAAFEEVLWRYLIQQHLLAGTAIAVPAAAAAFCTEHFLWERPRKAAQAVEFLGLALCLGLSVSLTGSIVPAVFMHWTRNLCVLRCSDGG